MATVAPGVAAAMPSVMVSQGRAAVPSLLPPPYAASTNWAVASDSSIGYLASPHGATGRQAASPTGAICPRLHAGGEAIGSHWPSSAIGRSGAHWAMPAGMHVPSGLEISPALQAFGPL